VPGEKTVHGCRTAAVTLVVALKVAESLSPHGEVGVKGTGRDDKDKKKKRNGRSTHLWGEKQHKERKKNKRLQS